MPWQLYYPLLMRDLITLEWSESNLACFVVETWYNYYIIASLNIITETILDNGNMEEEMPLKKKEETGLLFLCLSKNGW